MKRETLGALREELLDLDERGAEAIRRSHAIRMLLECYGVDPLPPRRTARREAWLRANFESTMLERDGVLAALNALPGAPMAAHDLSNWTSALNLKRSARYREEACRKGGMAVAAAKRNREADSIAAAT